MPKPTEINHWKIAGKFNTLSRTFSFIIIIIKLIDMD